MEQDFSKKIIVVVRNDVESWQVANVLAHIGAFIGNKLGSDFDTGDTFISKDGVAYPRNAQYPIIVKRAKSNEQLHNLMDKVRAVDLLCHCFVREMIDHTNDTELQSALSNKNNCEVEYLGVGIFGTNEDVAKLTKKFGLWE